ncbi:MAG: HEAT repeat domain-containing protein [Planctomycetaceae bacterium]|nr:MAG: HEAT repeat domain-containing protein [Planctomycetaceae bacterium]
MRFLLLTVSMCLVSTSLVQGQAPNATNPLPNRSLTKLLETIRNPARSIDRVQAAEEIAGFGSHAVAPLIEILATDDASVQASVLLALRRIGTEAYEAVPAVIAIAVDADNTLQNTASDVLGAIGRDSAEAVPALAALLPVRNEERRQIILNSLLSIGDAAAHQALADAYQHGDRAQQSSVLRALGQFPEATTALMPILVDQYVQGSRRFEVHLLRLIDFSPEASIPYLIASLESGPVDRRRRALMAMCQSQVASAGSEAVPLLTESLQDADPVVRFWALKALGAIGVPAREASSRIIDCLRDSDADVRWQAIGTVQQLGLVRQAVEPLKLLLDDPHPAVQNAAEQAIRSPEYAHGKSS